MKNNRRNKKQSDNPNNWSDFINNAIEQIVHIKKNDLWAANRMEYELYYSVLKAIADGELNGHYIILAAREAIRTYRINGGINDA